MKAEGKSLYSKTSEKEKKLFSWEWYHTADSEFQMTLDKRPTTLSALVHGKIVE